MQMLIHRLNTLPWFPSDTILWQALDPQAEYTLEVWHYEYDRKDPPLAPTHTAPTGMPAAILITIGTAYRRARLSLVIF